MMRVLVLGANGFVGRHLVRALAESGWATPVAAGRSEVEARNEAAIVGALNGVDAVVNCVAGDAESIVQNAQALFAATAKTGAHAVYLSSMAVYGNATGTVDEDAPLLGNVGDYSAAKVRAEALASGRVTIFRPGCIYGSDSPQWALRIARLLQRKRIGDLGAAGDGCSNVVHVADVAAAVLAAVRAGRAGVFNLAMPAAPDWNEYFVRFAQAIGAVPVARIPEWRLKLETRAMAAPLKILEMAGLALAPPIPPSRELGIAWTGLDAGLAEAAKCCRR
jgi:nucleoside-diphosphate-sugar epimerase